MIIGVLIARYVSDPARRRWLAGSVVVVFLVVSTMLYLDVLPWWFGRWMDGSDWMLNSGLGTNLVRQGGFDVLAVVLFAAYPLWMKLGLDLGRASGTAYQSSSAEAAAERR